MTTIWEKLASAAITIAALAIAVVVVRREFFAKPLPAPSGSRESTYIADWKEILPSGRTIGNANAQVQIITFMDLECPFCSKFHATANKVLDKWPKEVALVFVHRPIATHRFALPAARAVECASTLGKFKETVDGIFEQQDSLGLKTWTAFARGAGIQDTNRFAACMRETGPLQAVEKGIAMADKIGVGGTPTIILNGWRYGSPPSEAEINRAIEDLLAGKRPYPEFQVTRAARP